MLCFGRNRDVEEVPAGVNWLCVFNESSEKIEFLNVYKETANELHTSAMIVPRGDVRTRFLPQGGTVHFLNCTIDMLQEYENIADLEQSVVLKNITSFDTKKSLFDDLKWYVLIVAFIIIVAIIHK